ncbi:EF-hand [Auricularia subglabra TFB-10046 SS5]|nr:EF-hand [Auricularia subglabra TFB-10046 SS5]
MLGGGGARPASSPSPNPQHHHRQSYGSPQQQQQQQQQQQYAYQQQQHYGQQQQYAYQHQQQQQAAPGYGNSSQFAGGFQAQSRAPPPNADPTLWAWFSAVDVDGSGSISATELQQALVNGNWTQFDLDTVKMLMTIFDTDRSGTIGFNEFAGLWKYISDWQNVFRHFDRDRSGSIDNGELQSALKSFGYHLSPATMRIIADKYSIPASLPPASGHGPAPGITFDRFVRACVVVKTLTENFQGLDTDRDGVVTMSYDQFMRVRQASCFCVLLQLPFTPDAAVWQTALSAP